MEYDRREGGSFRYLLSRMIPYTHPATTTAPTVVTATSIDDDDDNNNNNNNMINRAGSEEQTTIGGGNDEKDGGFGIAALSGATAAAVRGAKIVVEKAKEAEGPVIVIQGGEEEKQEEPAAGGFNVENNDGGGGGGGGHDSPSEMSLLQIPVYSSNFDRIDQEGHSHLLHRGGYDSETGSDSASLFKSVGSIEATSPPERGEERQLPYQLRQQQRRETLVSEGGDVLTPLLSPSAMSSSSSVSPRLTPILRKKNNTNSNNGDNNNNNNNNNNRRGHPLFRDEPKSHGAWHLRTGSNLWTAARRRMSSLQLLPEDLQDIHEGWTDENAIATSIAKEDPSQGGVGGIAGAGAGAGAGAADAAKKNLEEEIQRRMDIQPYHALLAIVLYLLLAVGAYSFVFESWPIVNSLYFAVVTFTTIGYGDLYPSTHSGRIFTCFFALGGVSCLGVALGVLGSNLIDAEVHAMKQAQEMSRHRIMTLFERDDEGSGDGGGGDNKRSGLSGADEEKEEEQKHHPLVDESSRLLGSADTMKSSKVKISPLSNSQEVKVIHEAGVDPTSGKVHWYGLTYLKFVPIFAFLLAGSFYIGRVGHWDWSSIIYYCIVTTCTIGYGDFTPTTTATRWFAVVFIPLAVGAMGEFLSTVANSIIETRQAELRRGLRDYELRLSDLEAMDADKDGSVTKSEFVEFMLVAMRKVDRDLIDELHEQFDRLDEDGSGLLTREDLKIVAKRKMKSAKRKLELAEYKRQLLSKAATAQEKERIALA